MSDQVTDPQIAALRFEPQQLLRARELRGLTKAALAEAVGKSPSAITQFEKGDTRPDAGTVAELALALGIPVGFLAREPMAPGLRLEDCHFRSLRSTSQYVRRQALRVGEVVHEVSVVLDEGGVELPTERLSALRRPRTSPESIEQLAAEVRQAWGLGLGPITRPIALLETNGVRVLPLADVCAEVDAFSMWLGGAPFVLLAMQKAASRTHFDAAHELGHLLMHEDAAPGDTDAEAEAHQFAAAFLLPRDTFLRECPNRWSLPSFLALKRRWCVSVQALVVRAHRLGRLSTSSYRNAFQQMNARHIRTDEPDEWVLDGPVALRKALEMVRGYLPMSAIAERLAMHEADLAAILRPVTGDHGLHGESTATSEAQRHVDVLPTRVMAESGPDAGPSL